MELLIFRSMELINVGITAIVATVTIVCGMMFIGFRGFVPYIFLCHDFAFLELITEFVTANIYSKF